eukprot:351515-Chlamydomonas_euryale.AAC.7
MRRDLSHSCIRSFTCLERLKYRRIDMSMPGRSRLWAGLAAPDATSGTASKRSACMGTRKLDGTRARAPSARATRPPKVRRSSRTRDQTSYPTQGLPHGQLRVGLS